MGKIICGIDIETTGLDIEKDFIMEIAWVIRDTADPKPLKIVSKFVLPADPSALEIPAEVTELTKITKRHLSAGQRIEDIAQELSQDLHYFKVEAFVAHNGTNFDKPFMLRVFSEFREDLSEIAKTIGQMLWVDTATDLPLPAQCKHNNLLYLAAFHNLLNPFPHAALSDVQSMLAILEHYDINEVFMRANSPWLTIQAVVSFEAKDLAKARRYTWEKAWGSSEHHPRKWVKRVRAIDLDREMKEAPFQVVKV